MNTSIIFWLITENTYGVLQCVFMKYKIMICIGNCSINFEFFITGFSILFLGCKCLNSVWGGTFTPETFSKVLFSASKIPPRLLRVPLIPT